MLQISTTQLTDEWILLLGGATESSRALLQAIAEEHNVELARYFYEQMLLMPQAQGFLDHEQVKARLGRTMAEWVVSVFSCRTVEQVQAVIGLQQKIGEIHARIEVPVSLVMRGARWLKKRLGELVGQRSQSEQVRRETIDLGAQIVDFSIEIMCFAFSVSHERNSRAEEAYRLFSVAQNIGAEKERQRAALLDWENQLMFDLTIGDNDTELPTLAASEFGMWFRHKASHAFQGSPESSGILEYLEQIDVSLPALKSVLANGIDLPLLRHIREQTKAIKFLLDSLFEQADQLEAGRDVLTRLLNRKFLPVVMTKEINYSRKSGSDFGVLAIDVDHFKQINDNHGHSVGDAVLQQLGALLTSNIRGGDYAFRLGGEEFLVILVDIDEEKAFRVAEKLRMQVRRERFQLPHGETLKVTVSIGIALHDGHPDYQRLMQRADQALYQAKHRNRDCCVIVR